jgi:hypothetical protein
MKLRLSLSLAAALLASAASDAIAQETCDEGRVPVYWLESVGLPNEPWRDIYVFDIESPDLVLHYDPDDNKAEWLYGHTSGTNVVVWNLQPVTASSDTPERPFRWARIVGDDIAPPSVRGKAATALIVDTSIYWPICKDAETVEYWKLLADRPPG